jgi:aryl-alcohol dehydrogenase-like predicted oxidoreductase
MYLSLAWRPDEPDALRTIHCAIDAGVTLIDTADAYCLDENEIGHNERLIAKALRGRHDKVLVATKGGLSRPRGEWLHAGSPAHLAMACERSLAALAIDAIDLYQLHAPDTTVPFEESVGAMARLLEQGKVRRVGLSNVSVDQIERARRIVPIATVQNRWSPYDRTPETSGVLAYCAAHAIAFLAYSPFGGGNKAKHLGSLGTLAREASAWGMSPHRMVLAWMLAKSPVAIPIPGARRAESILDSAVAGDVEVTPEDVAKIEAAFG